MPAHPCPHHCPGGSGGGLIAVLLAAIVAAAVAQPVIHAAEVVLEVVLITAAVTAGLAVAAAVAYAAWRVHRWRANSGRAVLSYRLSDRRPAALSARQPPAIEAAGIKSYSASSQQVRLSP